ncbi:PBECR2 nuclease fold domain-containing protein [Bacteroides sp.]|uniref:PBECR3 domain-containing polyvalent protein n=1 Tax=Bacteroides sp. TaxID=29523 RepID=UPI0026029B8B|nr:PBECR2 nuclease fold domain-containing protein [Bacteroides sp.]MDD3040653.1 PBECR2 nuclease fold domain-containing protein [Bacteroides sp.]
MSKSSNKASIKKIGCLTKEHIVLLGLSFEPSPILIGPSNQQHMLNEHPDDYSNYFDQIAEILKTPDYIGKHPFDGSIKYIKSFEEHVLVAVRVSSAGKFFARSIYTINAEKLEHYIESGNTFKIG